MSEYDLLKESRLTAVEALKPSIREAQRNTLAQIETKLKEEVFNLVILGRFKRGKSTFINPLLGEDHLGSKKPWPIFRKPSPSASLRPWIRGAQDKALSMKQRSESDVKENLQKIHKNEIIIRRPEDLAAILRGYF